MKTTKAPRGAGPSVKPWSLGERGHQVCAEPSAALGSEGSSRTTGKLNAWERGEVRCGVMAWEVIVSFPLCGGDTRNSPRRRGWPSGGWLASGGAACARWDGATRTAAARTSVRLRAARAASARRCSACAFAGIYAFPRLASYTRGRVRIAAYSTSDLTPTGSHASEGEKLCAAERTERTHRLETAHPP